TILGGCGGDDDGPRYRWENWFQGRGPARGNDIPNQPQPEPEPQPEPQPEPEPEPQPVPNSAPTISGTPPTSVVAGSNYRFEPKASDADGDVLTFEIRNKPSWASFDRSTGVLAGTPSNPDVGSYSNIVIRLTDGEATARLPAFT